MKTSLAICTHNRSETLALTLSYLLQHIHISHETELLLIDNNSTDLTARTCNFFIDNYSGHSRYIFEPKLGIAHARNRAIKEAFGEIVLFLDDDALPLYNDWVSNITALFDNENILSCGGDIIPVWPNMKPPKWMHKFFYALYGQTSFKYDKVTKLTYPNFPGGANVAYRKEAVNEVGGFSDKLGWIASNGIPGEETDLCKKLSRIGQVVYVPYCEVLHFFQPSKLNIEWLMNRGYAQGLAFAKIGAKTFLSLEFFRTTIFHTFKIIYMSGYLLFNKIMRNEQAKLYAKYHIQCCFGFFYQVYLSQFTNKQH